MVFAIELIFKCCIDDVLRAEDNANITVNFQGKFFSNNQEFTDILIFMYFKTKSTSQMKVYYGCGSLSLKTPISNAQIFRSLSIGSPLIKLWYAETADRCEFTVQY